MRPALRPINLGEILDRTFQIYRSRFLAFVGIAAIPAVAMRLVYLVDSTWLHVHSLFEPEWRSGEVMWNFVVALCFYHVSSFLFLLVLPAHIKLASCVILDEGASFRSSLRFAIARLGSYLWITCLKLAAGLLIPELIVAGLIIGEAVLAQLTGAFDNLEGTAILPAFIVPALIGAAVFLWLLPRLSLAMPAAALENLKGFKSLRRSWTLSRGTRSRILFTWVGVSLLSGLAQSVAEYLLRLGYNVFARDLHAAVITRSIYLPAAAFLTIAIVTLIGPINHIALTLFYYDQRIRKEGFDIERMMEATGLDERPALPAGGQ